MKPSTESAYPEMGVKNHEAVAAALYVGAAIVGGAILTLIAFLLK